MSDLPDDPALGGEGDDLDLDQPDDLETEVENEAEPGAEPEEAIEDEPEPEPRRTRGPRGRPAGQEIRELRTSLERTQRELDEIRRRPAQPPFDPAAARAEEDRFWAAVEMMPQREALQAVYQRARQEVQQQLGQTQHTTQEAIDRQSYESAARASRVHQQYRQRVEDLVANERTRGNVVPREVALKFLLGEDAINRANRVVPGQQRAAQRRVAAQQTRPTNGRGDVARGSPRRSPGDDDEALLRQITAGDI